jgi:hypothetical protein
VSEPWAHRLEGIRPSTAVKTAIRLLVTGACKTKREAAVAAGLHPAYLTQVTTHSAAVIAYLQDMEALMTDKTADMSVVMNNLGRVGIAKIAQLAVAGGNERIQLDAAKTLADRSPDTAGIQKIQDAGLSLGAADAQALAAALIESAKLAAHFDHVAKNGLVEVDITQGATDAMPALPAPQGSPSESSSESQGSGQGSSVGDQANVQEQRALKLLD